MVDGNKLKHGELLLHDINNERGNQKREERPIFIVTKLVISKMQSIYIQGPVTLKASHVRTVFKAKKFTQ